MFFPVKVQNKHLELTDTGFFLLILIFIYILHQEKTSITKDTASNESNF